MSTVILKSDAQSLMVENSSFDYNEVVFIGFLDEEFISIVVSGNSCETVATSLFWPAVDFEVTDFPYDFDIDECE